MAMFSCKDWLDRLHHPQTRSLSQAFQSLCAIPTRIIWWLMVGMCGGPADHIHPAHLPVHSCGGPGCPALGHLLQGSHGHLHRQTQQHPNCLHNQVSPSCDPLGSSCLAVQQLITTCAWSWKLHVSYNVDVCGLPASLSCIFLLLTSA